MTMGLVAMAKAKKKAVGRPKVSMKRDPIVSLRGTPEFKTWLDAFSEHCGLSLVDTIGQALQTYADQREFRPPPKR